MGGVDATCARHEDEPTEPGRERFGRPRLQFWSDTAFDSEFDWNGAVGYETSSTKQVGGAHSGHFFEADVLPWSALNAPTSVGGTADNCFELRVFNVGSSTPREAATEDGRSAAGGLGL